MPLVRIGCTEAEGRRVGPAAIRLLEEARARRWPFLSDVFEPALGRVAASDRPALVSMVQALVKYDRLVDFSLAQSGAADRVAALLALGADHGHGMEEAIDRIDSPTTRLGVRFSLPDWLVDTLRSELGEPALPRALAWLNDAAPRVARVNTLLTTRDDCLRALAGESIQAVPTRRAAWGLRFDSNEPLFRTAAFASGAFEIQDEASQLVAEVVAPPPRSLAVDACAGAGGKTLALAAMLQGRGRVVALDRSIAKLEELRRRARRAGASNVQGRCADLLHPGDALSDLEGRAARVLLDAPCSGLGAIRRNPELRWRLQPEDLPRLTREQDDLAEAAMRFVAPGGRLVVATCSILPSEGTRILEGFLTRHGDWSPMSVRGILGGRRTEGLTTPRGMYMATVRFDESPDGSEDGMDGFFVGVVRRAPPRERAGEPVPVTPAGAPERDG